MGVADGVTVGAGASTTVVTASVTTASSLLHFIDGAVTVIVAAGVAVTEGCMIHQSPSHKTRGKIKK
jgi:hypothetical protein